MCLCANIEGHACVPFNMGLVLTGCIAHVARQPLLMDRPFHKGSREQPSWMWPVALALRMHMSVEGREGVGAKKNVLWVFLQARLRQKAIDAHLPSFSAVTSVGHDSASR